MVTVRCGDGSATSGDGSERRCHGPGQRGRRPDHAGGVLRTLARREPRPSDDRRPAPVDAADDAESVDGTEGSTRRRPARPIRRDARRRRRRHRRGTAHARRSSPTPDDADVPARRRRTSPSTRRDEAHRSSSPIDVAAATSAAVDAVLADGRTADHATTVVDGRPVVDRARRSRQPEVVDVRRRRPSSPSDRGVRRAADARIVCRRCAATAAPGRASHVPDRRDVPHVVPPDPPSSRAVRRSPRAMTTHRSRRCRGSSAAGRGCGRVDAGRAPRRPVERVQGRARVQPRRCTASLLTAGVLLWNVAYATGTIDNLERFFESFGWESSSSTAARSTTAPGSPGCSAWSA